MEDRVTGIVEAVRLRVDEELRHQLQSLTNDHEQAILEARRASEQQAQVADERWSALLAESRTEAQRHVEEAVTAAREAFEGEREAERRAAAVGHERFNRLVADFDHCTSLTDALNHLARALAARPGGALLVARNGTFQPWRDSAGSPNGPPLGWEQLVDPVVRERTVQRRDGHTAVPLMIDRAVVAVVISRDTDAQDLTLELMASASAAWLTALTASRLVQAERWTRPVATAGAGEPTVATERSSDNADADADPELSARRYARLLISEIKLYNEAAVREGRDHRDLAHRLGPEITRARQIYDARVPPEVPGRAEHFQEELVRTLANGDASLLA